MQGCLHDRFKQNDDSELLKMYRAKFGVTYKIFWDDKAENWRDDIIELIESGKQQDMSDPKYPWVGITIEKGVVL